MPTRSCGLRFQTLTILVAAAQSSSPQARGAADAGLDPDHAGACGGFSLPHLLSVDSEGNLYVAQFGGPWIDKYVPKPGADPPRLIGQPLGP